MDQHIWCTAEVSHCSGCRNTKLQYLNSATGTSDSNIWVSISLTSTVDLENLSINIWPEHLTQISELVYLWLKFVPSRNTFLLRQCMNLTPQSQNIHFYLIGVICRLVIWSWNIRHLLCITVFLIILRGVLWKRHNFKKWLIVWQCLQCSEVHVCIPRYL